MLDELRKLNSELNEGLRLHIGTIDCDAFRGICSQERINRFIIKKFTIACNFQGYFYN
ncbi:hypothetical protein Mgra_00000749 [Meloidogyne graminicola]|uniref:Uncharacterized protein n=1 Tax=Meloidogyne graminicola TaxID=189291 RepID=A0A8T0A3C9_9BILA|nr:hypothetical protein Mgra_00000749 [Meloidogyne graminicola]